MVEGKGVGVDMVGGQVVGVKEATDTVGGQAAEDFPRVRVEDIPHMVGGLVAITPQEEVQDITMAGGSMEGAITTGAILGAVVGLDPCNVTQRKRGRQGTAPRKHTHHLSSNQLLSSYAHPSWKTCVSYIRMYVHMYRPY